MGALFCSVLLVGAWATPAAAAQPAGASNARALRTSPQALMGATVFAICPGTKLKRLDTDLHTAIDVAPRNASTVDVIFSGSFLPEVVDPDKDVFKKKFKGTFAAEFECSNGSTISVPKITQSSLGDDDKHHIVFPVELDLTTCPLPVTVWATFDAKGGSVNKKLVGDPVPLNFSFCALVSDRAVGIIPNSFSCAIGHPLDDQC